MRGTRLVSGDGMEAGRVLLELRDGKNVLIVGCLFSFGADGGCCVSSLLCKKTVGYKTGGGGVVVAGGEEAP